MKQCTAFGLALTVVLAAAASLRGAAPGVTISEHPTSVVLANGKVAVEIDKTTGDIIDLRYQAKSVFAGRAYLDWNAGKDFHLTGGAFRLQADPAGNGGDLAEVCIARKYGGDGPAFDVELHHVLRRGDSGFYSFAVFSHPAGYPPAGFGQSRFVMRVADGLFDTINVDDARRRLMPGAGTPNEQLGPKESMRMTSGPFAGFITDKYHFSADAGADSVHGWTGSASHLGCWVINPSFESENGGPTKQHNTAHFPQVLLKILTCGHYGAAGVQVGGPGGGGDAETGPAVEIGAAKWEKLYGPWMIYLNTAPDPAALWTDAKQQAAAQQAAWPMAWMKHPLYPLVGARGAARGTLNITDPQDPKASAAGAWIGLAAPEPDWQKQSLGYQYWTHVSPDGSFTIPNVRPGTYTLYAFVDGVFGEFRRDNVAIAAGQVATLGTLVWQPERHGRQLWQIGTPDRTAAEFRHGDETHQWGLWLKYPAEFPEDVNFVIGRSHEATDWNFAQVTVNRSGQLAGTKWSIAFDLPAAPNSGQANLRIGIASAQNARLVVAVNGRPVRTVSGLGADNAMVRASNHGQYSLVDVPFATALLRPGRNTISLEQTAGGSPWKSLMYDALRLEVP